MGFRDDDLATRSRVDMLEREVRELRAENAQLQARPDPKPPRQRAWRKRLLIAIIALVTLALMAIVGAILARDPKLSINLALMATVCLGATPSLAILRSHLLFVPAKHLLIISGRQWRTAEGRQVGYRIVKSGFALQLPFLEKSELLATGPFSFETHIAGVYLKGNTPADLHLRASVHVPTSEPGVHNAVERFVGRESTEIERVAGETLEGIMREVAARMSREELQTDRLRIAAELSRTTSEADFEHLGLSLESFEILDVTDCAA